MAAGTTRKASPARRVTTAAIGVLVLVALVAGGGVFLLMQQLHARTVEGALAGALQDRRELLESQLRLHESRAEDVAQIAELRNALASRKVNALEAVLYGAVVDEVRAVSVLSAAGAVLSAVGAPVPSPALEVALATPLASELLWSDRPVLRTRVPVRRDGRTLGVVVVEQTMYAVGLMLKAEVGTWKSGEIALCFARDARLHCLPQRRNAQVVQVPLRDADGAMLPAARAVQGRSGVVRTPDSLGYDVIAAYGPVGSLGLLMAVEVDADEITGPLRRQLSGVVLLAFGAIGLGVWLLRRSVHPLAARIAAAEVDAREARDQMQHISDNVPALIGYLDRDERYRFVNRTYERWFGQPATAVLGKTLKEVWDAERFAANRPNVLRALAGERVEFERTLKTGETVRHLRTTYVPDLDAEGKARGFFILSNDVSDQVESRRELDRAMQKLDFALDASRVAVWETDLRSGETVLSDAWAEILDRARAETRTSTDELASLVHPDDLGRVRREVAVVLKGEKPEYAVEHRVRAESGHWKWILSRGRVMSRDPATGEALAMMGTNLDITERKRGEIEMERMANYDGLTGAVNRNLFRDRLRRAIAQCRRTKGHAALMYLDIDKFKGINDTLGHAAGDALLREFAARLKAAVRDTDTVGRLGGDEFAVLMEDVKDAEAPARVAQKILEAMRVPVDADGTAVTVTTSIGVALFDGGADAEALAKRADEALYAAKAAGRDTYRVAA